MSRNPFDWPSIGNIIVSDTFGRQHRVDVRKRPGESGTNVGGGNWHVESSTLAFFLNGTPLQANGENEGVFFSVTSNEVYRKV